MPLKNKRNRFFSLIFVPDQDQNPKSFSMSYAKGFLIVFAAAVLSIHIILGALGYYRIYRYKNRTHSLQNENESLKAQNKQIEKIAREFQKLCTTDDKIRSALVASLGLSAESLNELEKLSEDDSGELYTYMVPKDTTTTPAQSGPNHLSLLSEKRDTFFNPENLPTFLPVQGHVTTHFQQGGWFLGRSHLGIDIAARRGTVIKAAGAGIVLLADYTADFGNAVIISHGDGLFTYYGHAMHLLVKRGMKVTRGEEIALLGSSGPSSAPHLHFEIWKNGKALDPERCIFALNQGSGEAGLW
jgi:murein DD-endopeptidase MepM/ murein hydrolase activator NlpD